MKALGATPILALLALAIGSLVVTFLLPPAMKVIVDQGEVLAYGRPIMIISAFVLAALMLVRHVVRGTDYRDD